MAAFALSMLSLDVQRQIDAYLGFPRSYRENGAPFDRGGADRYYARPYTPHYFVGKTSYQSLRICAEQMTAEELRQYDQGWSLEIGRKYS